MSDLLVWKRRELDKLRHDMDDLFSCLVQDFSCPFYWRPMPQVTSQETDKELVIQIRIKDLDPKSLQMAVTDQTLLFKGCKKGTAQDNLYLEDNFSGSIHLSCKVSIEDIKADYRQEILTVKMPKCPSPRFKNINIEFE